MTQTLHKIKDKTPMNVTAQLSMLWLIVMFNMIYADILAFISAFITPGVIDELMSGYSGSVKLSQKLLLISAILIEIPIIMIFLSRILKYQINRWANIIAALLTMLFVIGGIETNPFFLFLASIEILVMFYIIFIAVRWQNPQNLSN
ncbi:DUF6326 family protein [Pseudoalteromonas denitrificans]|uniref:Uncharacterized protein n=1 Tax=Pseudoalteromonas denitrificans DSM 6059 TaxID=1123010 RepID=A0A1I1J212_9GAMM|nr:DUF6326 family protein [Pseudoalteromonas denitrificans]SFC42052.1 hypothetical protein SAMN02745724_01609 [Pseudoalteromonas denitrificans DSM 6059]